MGARFALTFSPSSPETLWPDSQSVSGLSYLRILFRKHTGCLLQVIDDFGELVGGFGGQTCRQ